MALFIPTYFSPISQYSAMYNADNITFEIEDNYQKQTYRNRCYIFGPNGKQLLNIPVKHVSKTERKKTKDILVSNDAPWQSHHFKSLKTAYHSSPFFEYFEDDLAKLFNKKYKYLHDVTIDTFLFVTDALELSQEFSKTTTYEVNNSLNDFRHLAIAKNSNEENTDTYIQMFDEKHGFLPNLSILDLLFMEGNNTISFFK